LLSISIGNKQYPYLLICWSSHAGCFGTANSHTRRQLAPGTCVHTCSRIAANGISSQASSSSSSSSIHSSLISSSRRRQRLRHICSADAGGAAAAPAAEEQQQQVDPFSEDDLRDLTAVDSSLDDEALGEAWRSAFEDDLDGLYGYVDRCGWL
jgi:hypothetical protein